MSTQSRLVQKQQAATYQDVLDAPPNMVAEVLNGHLYTQPRPASLHAFAYSRIGRRIGGPFDDGINGPGGWWIIDEPELHLGEDILVPDIGGWRHETMPDFPDEVYFTIRPDWVCEVLSPSTRRIDRHEKAEIYAREGVSHMWLVDPEARLLEVFELRGEHWVLLTTLADDELVSQPPFDAITFPLDALWPLSTATASRQAGGGAGADLATAAVESQGQREKDG